MTTIFADAKKGVMVCDSKVSFGNEWMEDPNKVVRVEGELVGLVGSAVEADRWLEWYQTGQKGPMPKVTNSGALILNADGLMVLESSGGFWKVPGTYFGIGSGGPAARAAFMAGADARKAVEIACKIDNLSGGAIHIHKLKG